MIRWLPVVGLVLGGCSKRLPHSGEEPVFPLRGKHTAVSCERCHGTSGFGPLPVRCVDCHEVDRPTADHHPGEACDDCHVDLGWEVVTPTTRPTDTGFDHDTLPEDQLCWDCHEADRVLPTHYADPLLPVAQWADCSGCHTPDAWRDATEHRTRIPHGSTVSPGCTPVEDPKGWITGCVGCHPVSTDAFVCYTCHEDAHKGDNFIEAVCTGCHLAGEPTECEPLP